MIQGPFSDEFFWDEEPDSDPAFLNPWDETLSPHSVDDWDWEEWGNLTVFRPVGLEPRYRYPLVLWLSFDDIGGTTLRDWFPDLSDRNYLGAEVHLSSATPKDQIAELVSDSLRELFTFYNIHPQRIWIAGVGRAGEAAARLVQESPITAAGAIVIAPSQGMLTPCSQTSPCSSRHSLYLALTEEVEMASREVLDVAAQHASAPWRITQWESVANHRLNICRDLNDWLMQQICSLAGGDDPR